MIDINELHRKVNSTDIVDHIDLHANIKPFLSEMIDRLEAAESTRRDDYQNWMTALDRNAELLAKLEAAEKERDNVAQQLVQSEMERQRPEPAARIVGEIGEWVSNGEGTYSLGGRLDAFVPLRNGTLLYALPGAQTAPSFADAYQGAMEEVAIWKKRALEAEDLNRKFVTEINGPTYMGEPAQPAPSVPDGWKEAAIAWEVCASIHRGYGKGKDPFFNTRQGDFVKHANDARAMLAAAPEAKP